MLHALPRLWRSMCQSLSFCYWLVVVYLYVKDSRVDGSNHAGAIYLNTHIPDLTMYGVLSVLVRNHFLLGPDPRGDMKDLPPVHHGWWYHAVTIWAALGMGNKWLGKYQYHYHMGHKTADETCIDKPEIWFIYWAIALTVSEWKKRNEKPESTIVHNKWECPICREVEGFFNAYTIAQTNDWEALPDWVRETCEKYETEPLPKCPYA